MLEKWFGKDIKLTENDWAYVFDNRTDHDNQMRNYLLSKPSEVIHANYIEGTRNLTIDGVNVCNHGPWQTICRRYLAYREHYDRRQFEQRNRKIAVAAFAVSVIALFL
ncbi:MULTISPECIES: hypothetical protein [Kordiimonas]|jgi:hypothetical protein|uniref:hypothetical protein n=1 Tax=Kordiimonas TaxID=288021 RepID=UPI002580182E|nr:hypothetical protein [Kordiimonas sp. UBA4487]